MNTRRFVTGSSFVVAFWLGATFIDDVQAQRYPKLQKSASNEHLEAAASPEIVATTHH
jgi:hypothetical protein